MSEKLRRPLNPDVLPTSSLPILRVRIGGGAVAWRYTVLLPIDETKPGEETKSIATDKDQAALELALANHFNGSSILPAIQGRGLREGQVEMNTSIPYVVYAAAVTETQEYFRVLKAELEEALVQETILIERQEVWIF